MVENEFDEVITEGLDKEDNSSLTLWINGQLIQNIGIDFDNMNISVSNTIKDSLYDLEVRIKKLEDKHGQDEGST